jgi:hypothetical protein
LLEAWLVILRKAVGDCSYIISGHARDRMGERSISVQDLEECALHGNFIESQDHGQDLKALIQWVDEEGVDFYMVLALRYPAPIVVTVCRFREEAWADTDFFKRRKGR